MPISRNKKKHNFLRGKFMQFLDKAFLLNKIDNSFNHHINTYQHNRLIILTDFF